MHLSGVETEFLKEPAVHEQSGLLHAKVELETAIPIKVQIHLDIRDRESPV